MYLLHNLLERILFPLAILLHGLSQIQDMGMSTRFLFGGDFDGSLLADLLIGFQEDIGGLHERQGCKEGGNSQIWNS